MIAPWLFWILVVGGKDESVNDGGNVHLQKAYINSC